ncbi:NAD-dependent epimerase/dehydratase family protein [candidate division WOR-3 bacterium]|uniref:NAD-dependent epimerase/dehydratase family protein n=1 Tax=candidate division WOR-3 bacterium TaxID=2052148 RepID=A0A9D5K9A3_UNCW3|nr:NAD-dependent epimerase/dehydratase family protein [candidate division WOR-3 bacterium]MBD3364747.1 NAD-dependent epimerase/dehydratase family protein [candidate division WOR-3 bacterium]
MKPRSVLVTGGAGFIGSHLVERLLSRGDTKVTVLDKLVYPGRLDTIPSTLRNDPNFRFVRGDAGSKRILKPLLAEVDTVAHLAAETHIDRSILSIASFVRNDFVSTSHLYESLVQSNSNVERIVHISTSEVYGSAQQEPMTEAHPIAPQSPYAATKTGADRLAYSFYRTFNLPVCILRPFNMYGPRQHPEKLIPFFTTNALLDLPLYIYGAGTAERDWLWVEDGVRAIEAVLFADNYDELAGQEINAGTGRSFSINWIAKRILARLGKTKSLLTRHDDRPGHVVKLVSSSAKANRLLGWRPALSFEEGLDRTIDWYKNNASFWKKRRNDKRFREYTRAWYGREL